MVGFFSKGDCVSHVLLILPLWFIFYNLGSSLGYEAMKNGVDTCFNTCILRLPPCHLLNLPGLRYVSYLQEKYFHFSSTFSFALMSSEMYSLVQFTCGTIVCWELCLLRHNTLPNRHTTSWLFMTNSFKKPKTSISRDFSLYFLSRQFNGHIDLWILYPLELNSAKTYFLVSIMSWYVFAC